MSQVDPFIQPIPRQFREDRELRNWTEYLNRFLHDIWVRTGAGDDAIDSGEKIELYDPGIETNNNAERIEDLELDIEPDNAVEALQLIDDMQMSIVEVTANYTTTGNEIIICNNTTPITVTLNASPENGEKVRIKRRDSAVTVSGSIDGNASTTIAYVYDAPLVIYTDDASEWSLF